MILINGVRNINSVKDSCIKIMMLGVGACKMAKKDMIKAVIYVDDVLEKTHEELYKEFKKAIKKKKINHFEITTNDEARW
tara:strand:- start:295 stop:534 length:240 start_codon:yes stop_codon:yes gene_type:complete